MLYFNADSMIDACDNGALKMNKYFNAILLSKLGGFSLFLPCVERWQTYFTPALQLSLKVFSASLKEG